MNQNSKVKTLDSAPKVQSVQTVTGLQGVKLKLGQIIHDKIK
jgi:hypothetical protein